MPETEGALVSGESPVAEEAGVELAESEATTLQPQSSDGVRVADAKPRDDSRQREHREKSAESAVPDDGPVAAGEVVHLRAEGSYTVGSFYDAKLDPRGYSTEAARRYNFPQEPFASAPHATGIALAGKDERFVGGLVAPCLTFTSLYAGTLRVGVNDSDPANNEGRIAFEGYSRAPTVEEWGKPLNDACR